MSVKPRKPCKYPGCPGLSDSGYCIAHTDQERSDKQARERWRGTAASRGYDHLHRALREQVFHEQGYLCLPCLDEHRVMLATDLHHKLKVSTHPHLRLERSNVIGVCKQHHEELEKLSR